MKQADRTHVQPTASPASGPRPPGGRALVVEPDHLTAWSLAAFLERWYEVETTNCTVAAEQSLRERKPAAVIVSDQLPGRTAETLLRLAQGVNPNVRAILMTSRDGDLAGAPPSAIRLEKPFELAELARLLGLADEARAT